MNGGYFMYFYDLDEIKGRMKEKKLSVREMAKDINMSKTGLHNILKGHTSFDKVYLGSYKKIVNYLWKEV